MRKSKNFDIEAAKSFLENEKRSSQMQQPTSTSSSSSSHSAEGVSNPIHDLIKCFCGICESLFKRTSIEYALKANGDELLRNPEARNILKKFLLFRKGTSKFKLDAEQIVEIYELADDIVKGYKDLEENRADLDDLLFNENWEDQLTNAIDDGTTDDFLYDLQRECAYRIENIPEYELFKEELRNKLS